MTFSPNSGTISPNSGTIYFYYAPKLLLCPRPRTERFKNSVVYTTAKYWNELSLDEQRASSYNSFKIKTKKRELEKLLVT